MQTLADKTKNLIETECPGCFSLHAGYGLKEGGYVRFPNGVQEMEKRNKNGRCTQARYRYADGSRLTYKYSVARETYTLIAEA
jgi:hypothetical protein